MIPNRESGRSGNERRCSFLFILRDEKGRKRERDKRKRRTRQELLKKKREREREDEKRYLRLPTNELPYKEEPRHTVRAGTKRGRKREREREDGKRRTETK